MRRVGQCGIGMRVVPVVAACLLGACGGSDSDLRCGEGAHLTGRTCVGDDAGPGLECGPGTHASDGSCVPDDISNPSCGDGTILVDEVCVPEDDTLTADVLEGSEPNDVAQVDSASPEFSLPGVGEESVALGGCIVPVDAEGDGSLDPDRDSFRFTIDAPTLVEVTVDGTGGLAAAFEVTSSEARLEGDGWIRRGIDMTRDGASRALFLPLPGEYAITFTDSRSLLFGAAAGGTETCYFAEVSQVDLPEVVPLENGSIAGDLPGSPVFYSVTAALGDSFSVSLTTSSSLAVPALVVLRDDEYQTSHTPMDTLGPARASIGETQEGDVFTFVVDAAFNYAIDAVEFQLDGGRRARVTVPEGGGTVEVAQQGGEPVAIPLPATEGDIAQVRLNTLDEGPALRVEILDPLGETLSTPCFSATDGFSGCKEADLFFPVKTTGDHQILLTDPARAESEYSVDVWISASAPPALSLDEPVPIALEDASRAFFRLDGDVADWVFLRASTFSDVEDVRLALYATSESGVFDRGLEPTVSRRVGEDGGVGYIAALAAEPAVWVSVSDAGTHTGAETMTLTASAREYVDLGILSEASPLEAVPYDFEAAEEVFFVLRAAVGTRVTLTATPAGFENARIRVLGSDESALVEVNSEWGGGLETWQGTVSGEFLPFVLDIADAAPGAMTLGATADDPAYTVSPGDGVYSDICEDGTVLLTDAFDEFSAVQALGEFDFTFFGSAVTEFVVSSNGWLTFDPEYADEPYFFGEGPEQPNQLVAPLSDFLDAATVCLANTETTTTVQWSATVYDPETETSFVAEVQVVFSEGGTIEVRLGPDHAYPGRLSLPAILEDATGTESVRSPIEPAPGTSILFEPA